MKQFCFRLFLPIFFIACTPVPQTVVQDLQTAIEQEMYAGLAADSMARQAATDQIFPIEAFFQAVSQSKSIVVDRQQTALRSLQQSVYTPSPFLLDTLSDTKHNIKKCLMFEQTMSNTYDFDFIVRTKATKKKQIAQLFQESKQISENLQRIYTYLLGNIDNRPVLAAIYLVCPTCGNLFIGTTTSACEICNTPSSQFLPYSATHTDATTGATRIE